jgi:hypothetical protein
VAHLFIVAMPAVADEVDHDVPLELLHTREPL